MERGIVAGMSNPLEEIQIEICSGNCACDVRRVLLDATSVRRYHGDGRACVRTHADSVVGAFDLSIGQVFEIPVVVCGATYGISMS